MGLRGLHLIARRKRSPAEGPKAAVARLHRRGVKPVFVSSAFWPQVVLLFGFQGEVILTQRWSS